jgi:serine/threonine protein phosphatase PrpC
MVNVSFGVSTDAGTRRDLNEDAVLAVSPIFAVADGMGGHAAGEVASALAIEKMSVLAGRSDVRPDDVLQALDEANAAILAYERDAAETTGMGTTITGVCLGMVAGSPHWVVFNIGDSRVYRFADGELCQLTVDHSEVAELLAAGRITAQEALTHPLRNVVTRSLGVLPPPAADVWVLPVLPGERFLICSDGLPLEVPESMIAARLADESPAQDIADLLVSCAVSAGGRDNVSVVVVEVSSPDGDAEIDEVTAPRKRLAEPA